VLVIDEVGYLPLDPVGATLLFQLVSARYERGSIVLTSNKSYTDWGQVFGETTLAAAILDRLLHHSTTLNIRGESYRLKERRKAGLHQAHQLLASIRDEMQAYAQDRSDSWQESERGQLHEERIAALEEIVDALADLEW